MQSIEDIGFSAAVWTGENGYLFVEFETAFGMAPVVKQRQTEQLHGAKIAALEQG